MTEQCPSCGGFCKKGCERENVQPEQKHSEQWWRHEVSNAYANGYEKGRASVKQPEQEPVAWMYVNKDGECEQIEYGVPYNDPSVTPLYTAPPQREWQGLTEMEIMDICNFAKGQNGFFLVREVEAKLKEKNEY